MNSNTIITLDSDKLHVHISYRTNVLKVSLLSDTLTGLLDNHLTKAHVL